MLTAVALLAACAGDATAPDAPRGSWEPVAPSIPTNPNAPPSGFRVLPRSVTLEVDQRVRFRGQVRDVGKVVRIDHLHWEASGGTIESDGTFHSTRPGTYKVIGRGRKGYPSIHIPDTSIVVVVKKQPKVESVQVTPETPTVLISRTRTFTAVGRLPDGTDAAIRVNWSATGGTINQAGEYLAGDKAGTYRVIARSLRGSVADTVPVTVLAGEPEPEPQPKPEPTEPAVTKVVLRPAEVTMAVNSEHQFAAFGRNAAGDSVAVDVKYTATGGTISETGLFTAAATPGSYRVIAVSETLADTAQVTLAAVSGGETPPPDTTPDPTPVPGSGTGIPFGPFTGLAMSPELGPFDMAVQGVTAASILQRLAEARRSGTKLLLNMTGGSHENYLTGGAFDRAKWNARMDTYNTSTIRQAVAQAVADGIIVGNSVMDEPHVSGGGDGNTWGPAGTMTKAVVDDMCRYVKAMFPTLPVGVAHRHDVFEPTKSYRVCEFIVSQYSSRLGSVTAFRDAGLALARRDGHAIMFAMNIMNGGTQDRDGTWDCIGTGGKGTYAPNCRMTPQQVRDVGLALGPPGCGLVMWRYDETFMSKWENRQAFGDVAARLASSQARSCRRS